VSARSLTSPIAAALLLSGCAQSQVAIMPASSDDPAGSVAVLDAASDKERAVADQPGNVVSGSGKVQAVDPKVLDARYADLLANLPAAPRAFTLYFKENSTQLTPESEALMPQIFAELKARAGADLEITGHTDSVGAAEVNDAFSLRRAAEVTSYLFAEGLDKAIIRIAGRGERDLKEQTPDETPSAINRRVEVLVR
jgi:outer membrane protein OmpA-like peptidoglycan-associated protein